MEFYKSDIHRKYIHLPSEITAFILATEDIYMQKLQILLWQGTLFIIGNYNL